MKSLGRVFDLLVAVLVTVMLPLLISARVMDVIDRKIAETQTDAFVREIERYGCVSEDSLDALYGSLAAAGRPFIVSFSNERLIFVPDGHGGVSVYDDTVTSDEILSAIDDHGVFLPSPASTVSVCVTPVGTSLYERIMHTSPGYSYSRSCTIDAVSEYAFLLYRERLSVR